MLLLFLSIFALARLSFRLFGAPFLRLKQTLPPSASCGPTLQRTLADPDLRTL